MFEDEQVINGYTENSAKLFWFVCLGANSRKKSFEKGNHNILPGSAVNKIDVVIVM